LRLDIFLKRVGLIKQRALAKQKCDGGAVSIDGKKAKAAKEIAVGRTIELDLRSELLEIEVLDLPNRNYKRKAGESFYKIIKHECKDPLS
jgi:ribosomal 50S subunit-recycling heat shock protein